MRRNLNIAAVAAVILCPVVSHSQATVNINNAVGGAGHLDVNIDAYGAYGNFNGAYVDNYEPNAGGPSQPTFTAGIRLFAGANKVLLTDMPEWNASLPGSTWGRVITTPVNLVNAFTATSGFDLVAGLLQIPQLRFSLTQVVSSLGGGVALLDQSYTITNVSGNSMNVAINRVLDADLVWDGAFANDHVGAAGGGWVYQREPADLTQAMAMTAGPGGLNYDFYWGGKNTHVPTGGGPAFGFGTDAVVWNNGGLPTTWENYAAYVGYNTLGDSGTFAGQDAHIGIDWRLSLADQASANFTVRTMYGAVPEPASMLALGTGLVLLLRRRRRKTTA